MERINELPRYVGRMTLKDGRTVYCVAFADKHNIHEQLRMRCKDEHGEFGRVDQIVPLKATPKGLFGWWED